MRRVAAAAWAPIWALLWAAAAAGAPAEQPLPPTAGGAVQSIVTLRPRPGVSLPVLLIRPRTVRTGAVVFAGGTGRVGIYPLRLEHGEGLLLAGREKLAARGILLAIVDVPSDHDGPSGLTNFRVTPEHAADAAAVIHLLRERGAPTVWVMGASRGSVSAANAAARLAGADRPDGTVLLSSVLRPSGPADDDVLFHVPLDRIRGPVLIVHHEQDACPVTPPEDVPFLREAMGRAGPVEILRFRGGTAAGPPCTAGHHHGFAGQADAVLDAVGAWMLKHARRIPPDPAPEAPPVG